jgi:hypothetical protein
MITDCTHYCGFVKLYRALLEAIAEATDILNADKRAAATPWIEDSKSKLAPTRPSR